MSRRQFITILGLALLLAAAVVARLAIGGWGHTPEETASLLSLRVPRIWSGIIVGAALAVSGVFLQSLLRNPLASPDLLGLASGSGLGITIAIYLGSLGGLSVASVGANTTAALVGSLSALAVVYLLSQRRGLLDPISLILVGVVVSVMCGAGTEFLRHLLPDGGFAAQRLLVGGLRDDISNAALWVVGVTSLESVLLGVAAGRAMDASALGDDEARSLGVPLGALRNLLFIHSGMLAAGAVVLAGPIGFVGLICPHLVRLMAGPSHRTLVIGSALAGAALIVLADTLIKAVDLGSGRLPISVLTALLGGPVFIGLLRRRQRGEV